MGNFFRRIGSGIKYFFSAIGRFIINHKKISILAAIAIVGGISGFIIYNKLTAKPVNTGFAMPETTILEKTDLEQTVTANGTLQSALTRNVSSELSYNITEIHVSEGDVVQEGQLLAVVDSTTIDKNIADVKKKISDAEKSDALALQQAERKLQDAINQYSIHDSQTATDVQNALNSLNTANSARDTAQATMTDAKNILDSAITALNSYPPVDDEQHDPSVYSELQLAVANAQANYDKAKQEFDAKQTAASQAQTTYNNAIQQRDTTLRQDSISIENARDSVNNLKIKDSAESYRTQLKSYLEDKEKCSIFAPIAGTITAVNAEVGSSAGGGGTAGATNTGSTGATGSTSTGSGNSLFTIEDMSTLEIPLSIAEYDAIHMKTNLTAKLTSDAVEDKIWNASVTSISSTATDGYFTVMVKITSPADELVIGMSATVDIIVDSRQNVYAVPFDAVVKNAQGESVVYVLDLPAGGRMPAGNNADQSMPAGDPPADMGNRNGNFAPPADTSGGTSTDISQNRREIVVTTGFENDYYIEISGDDLEDGMLVLNDPLGLNVNNTSQSSSMPSGAFPGGGNGGGIPGGNGGGFPGGGRPPQ